MSYSVFNQTKNDQLKEPMFFGQNVNVSRYDQQKYQVFEKLIEKQLSFFWRPEEVDVSKDAIDFKNLPDNEKHIFVSNLKYQTLLDSIQGRSPNIALLPIASLPELETWVETWSFSESVHSRSYTHIIRNLFDNPSEVFDDIVTNEEIKKRASSVAKHYDELIYLTTLKNSGVDVCDTKLKTALYKCMVSINVLEAIRFYVSFACSFAFAEREVMEGNAKIIKLIARDEAVHLTGTMTILNLWRDREDEGMQEIAEACQEDLFNIFKDAAEQEKDWAKYLFQDGGMIGLNEEILCQYVEYITNIRYKGVGGVGNIYEKSTSNPIPWINNWLVSDNVQVAPQETEISSYLVGQVDSRVDSDDFDDFEL